MVLMTKKELWKIFMKTGKVSDFLNYKNAPDSMEDAGLSQEFAEEFRRENGGSIICRELLGLSNNLTGQESPAPSERTKEYYRKRPCGKIVGSAAFIAATKMIER